MTKRKSEEIRKLMASAPRSTVKVGPLTMTFCYSWRKHHVVWVDCEGRISEIDFGPRGAKVLT